MTEKLINSKPNGVFALILIELTIVLGIFIFIMGVGSENIFGIIIGPLLIVIAGLAHAGLKVVKPQEALVLTLFGNYTGTIKEPGFYFVNPFSVAVNPANHTRLGQSGDVSTKSPFLGAKSSNDNDVNLEIGKKQISLKVMTLSNSRQKINDCLGNPVEIGMVEMALERLNEGELVELDEERKAAMVSNLLVVLCGNHDAQPIVNTGSLY